MAMDDFGPGTLIQHLGEEDKLLGSIAPPIFQASNFAFEGSAAFPLKEEFSAGPPYVYSRVGNPTLDLAQEKIAALEGVERCLVTGSGMGAIASALMANLEQGAHIVSVDTCYGPVHSFLDEYMPKFGVRTTYVDGLTVEGFIDNIRPETKLIYLESPSTFFFRLQDLERVAKAAKEKGVVTLIDNTYATPLYQNPSKHGIDIVLHSVSKYMGGHSDIVAGAICGSEERLRPILKYEVNLLGNALAPMSAWLLVRGLRTLPVRLARNQENANSVAAFLRTRPEVGRIHHVGLPDFPQAAMRDKQMRGTTGLFSFEPVNQDFAAVRRFCDALKVFTLGVSWGGFESLAIPIETQPFGYDKQVVIVRLYTGLEDAKDLIEDLRQAFESSGLGR